MPIPRLNRRTFRHAVQLASSKKLRTLAATFLVGFFAKLAVLAMTIALARELSPQGFGSISFAIGAAAVSAELAGLGLPALMSRLIPSYRAQERWSHLMGLVTWSTGIVLLSSLIVCGGLIGLSRGLKVTPDIQTGLLLAAFIIVPQAVGMLKWGQLAGFSRAAVGIFLVECLPPMTVIAALLMLPINEPAEVVFVISGAMTIAVVTSAIYTSRLVSGYCRDTELSRFSASWIWLALPLWVGVGSKVFLARMDVLMLGPLAGMDQVGYYGGAFRIANALAVPQLIMMAVTTPWLSAAVARLDVPQMWRYFWLSVVMCFATTLPFAGILFFFSDLIVTTALGVEYAPSIELLQLTAISQTFAAAAVPLSGLLIAVGRGKLFAWLNLIMVAICAALNFLLIPGMGAKGAAIAALISTMLIFLAQAWSIYKIRRNPLAMASNLHGTSN